MRDLKNKVIVGLILLAIGQAVALFGMAHRMEGKIETLQVNQQTMMAAMMGQSHLPHGEGPIEE